MNTLRNGEIRGVWNMCPFGGWENTHKNNTHAILAFELKI